MLTNINIISILQNTLVTNEYTLKQNLDLETLKLDLTNQDTLNLYKINQDLQNINNRVDFLIYKLVCLFNFLLSKKGKQQLFEIKQFIKNI